MAPLKLVTLPIPQRGLTQKAVTRAVRLVASLIAVTTYPRTMILAIHQKSIILVLVPRVATLVRVVTPKALIIKGILQATLAVSPKAEGLRTFPRPVRQGAQAAPLVAVIQVLLTKEIVLLRAVSAI